MIHGADNDENQIYDKHPHVTMDNCFSGDKISDWIGQNGFGCTMTCRRDRLPSGVPGKYWHKEKTDSSQQAKVARFFQPVVAIKDVEKNMVRVHTERYMFLFNQHHPVIFQL